MTQTPLQEALSKLGMMRQTENENVRMTLNANEVAMMLNSLLPKEKEFAEKCFDAGHSDQINRTKFINQLYPKS